VVVPGNNQLWDDNAAWPHRPEHPNPVAAGQLTRVGCVCSGKESSRGTPPYKSGRTISFPVVVADYEGERYLVAMLGQQTNGVRNLRAGDGRAVLQHGQREDVSLVDDLHYPSKLLRIRYHVVAQYISPTRESWSRRAS
jgi:hypothetical protein